MSNPPNNSKAPAPSAEGALAALIRSRAVLGGPTHRGTLETTDIPRILAEHRLHALATAKANELSVHLAEPGQASGLLDMLVAARQSLRLLALRDAILEKGLADGLAALERAGVQPILLKGRALALTLYDEPWHRPHSDVDILIHPDDIRTVRRVLSRAGFTLPHGIRGQFTSHQFLYSRELSAGVELHLDIHWKLSNRHQFAHAITYDEARRRAQTLYLCNVPHRVVGYEDALLHALIHLYAHHHDEFQPAIWLYDIYLLMEQLDDAQVLAALHRAESAGASSVVKRGIERVAEACGVELSEKVRGALSALREDESVAFFDMGRIDEIRSDLRVIQSPLSRARYLGEVAFPPAQSMLDRYGYQSSLMLPIAYVRRAFEFIS